MRLASAHNDNMITEEYELYTLESTHNMMPTILLLCFKFQRIVARPNLHNSLSDLVFKKKDDKIFYITMTCMSLDSFFFSYLSF